MKLDLMLIFLVVAIANLFFESAKAISWSSGWYSKGTSWLQWDDSCKTWADSSSWLTWESYMYYDDSSKKWAFCLDGEYYDSTYNNLKIEFKKIKVIFVYLIINIILFNLHTNLKRKYISIITQRHINIWNVKKDSRMDEYQHKYLVEYKQIYWVLMDLHWMLQWTHKKVEHFPKKLDISPKKSWTLTKKYLRHYFKYALLFKIIFIIKSSSGPCHEDPGDPATFTGFCVIDYLIPNQSP